MGKTVFGTRTPSFDSGAKLSKTGFVFLQAGLMQDVDKPIVKIVAKSFRVFIS